MMSLANLFTTSSLGCFFLFPLFVTAHGGTKADIGILMGAFTLSSVLCRPWISDMVDHLGRRRSYGIGCMIMCILPFTYLLFGGTLSSFYFPLILVRILHGVGLAICFTAAFTYATDIIPPDRLNEGIGMFGVTGLTGMALGPVFAEIIIQRYGFSALFLSSSALAALGLLFQLRLPESFTNSNKESAPSFFGVFRRRKFLILFTLALLFGMGLSASGGFVAPYAREKHIAFVSFYFICYSGAAVLTRFIGGRLADRVGEERIIPYAMIITGSGLLLLIFLEGNPVLIFSGFMTGCGHGFLFPCLNALAVRNEPLPIRGKINGVFTGGIDGGVLVGSVALGYLGEWGGFQALFLGAGLCLLLGIPIFRFRGTAAGAGARSPSGGREGL
jgi:MFS family permease